MGIVNIPARIITTCDRCGIERSSNFKSDLFTMEGTIYLKCEGLDYSGVAVAPGDRIKYILCNECYIKTRASLEKELEK